MISRFVSNGTSSMFSWVKRVSLGAAIVAAGFLVMGALSLPGRAQEQKSAAPTSTSASTPDLSVEGDWVRTDPDGSGSFGGLASKFPPAELTPEGKAILARGRGGFGGPAGVNGDANEGNGGEVHKVGDPYVVVSHPCGNGPDGTVGNGAGTLNPDSGGFHIVVAKKQVVFSGERGGSRIIYLDRQPPTSMDWTRSGGFSVGHFEGNVLIADTVGMIPGPVVARGVRSRETHLTERFEVSPDGKHMKITYTYNDPKLYVKPHTYYYEFDRITPLPSYAFEEWCDAGDPIEGQSIVPPPQN